MTTKTIYDAAILGAGASGLMAAVTAARAGANVILLEHMEQAGKKILATGNGKCNYTNTDLNLESYYCSQPGFVKQVLHQFSCQDTIRFFEELGVRPVQKNGTCIYPECGQASAVRQVLLAEVKRLRIPLVLAVGIRSVQKVPSGKTDDSCLSNHNFKFIFKIEAKEQTIYSHHCILATGGQAAKKTGSDGSGYLYAKQLGHTIQKPLPALVPLTADMQKWKLPAGIRISCMAALSIDQTLQAAEYGELQITDYGISGIVIFQFSRMAAAALAQGRQVQVCLDWKPRQTEAELEEELSARFSSKYHAGQTVEESLTGFLPDKLLAPVCGRAGIKLRQPCAGCERTAIQRLAALVKGYDVCITGTKNFDSAQVTAGGVRVHEIHAQSMESKKVPGLYFAGEIIDVDAKCGGYNLQWAWASGYVAGKNICPADINRKKGYGNDTNPSNQTARQARKKRRRT